MNDVYYRNQMKHLPFGYAYHQVVFDNSGTPCDYIFLEVNKKFEELTGLRLEDIVNKKATDILPDLRIGDTDWISIYGKVAVTQNEVDFIAYSEPLDTHYKVHAYSDEKGYFTTIFTYDPNHSFRTLFMNMNSGAVIYEVQNDGKSANDYIIKEINDQALSLEKKTRDEVLNKSVYEIREKVADFGLIKIFHNVWKTGIPQIMSATPYPDEKIERWYENQVFKLSKNEIVALYNDVTDFVQNQINLESSRKNLETIVSSAPYGIFVADRFGKYTDVNPEACKITGYTKNELIGMNLADLTADDYKSEAVKHFSMLKYQAMDYGKEVMAFITKNGEKRYWTIKATKLNENSYLGITEDITDKLVLENKLREATVEMKSLFDNSGLGMGYYSPDGTVIWYNKLASENMGGKPEDFEGKSLFEIFPKENADIYMDRITQSINSMTPIVFKDFLDLAVGRVCFLSTYNCIRDNDENILGVQIISQDVTEIENSRLAVEQSKQLLEETQAIAHVGSWSVNTINNEMTWSDEIYKIGGQDPSSFDLSFENISKVIHPDDLNKFTNAYENMIKGVPIGDYELRIIRPDGSIRWVLLQESIKESAHTHLGSLLDITDQKNYIETIERSLNSISQAESIAKLGFFTRNWQTGEAYWSDGFFNLLGIEIGNVPSHSGFVEYIHDDDRERVEKHIKESLETHSPMSIQFRITRKDNTIIHINSVGNNSYDSNNNPLTTVGVFQDITVQVNAGIQKQKLEEFLSNKQRLESIGTLASGVAHEINNPLNGILNYGQLILDMENIDKTAKEYASEIISESERVAIIVKNLLDFSRQNKQTHSYANVEDIIDKTVSLVKTIIKHDQIDLQIDVPENLSRIKCRSQNIQQVIMNLLTNARDALNEKYKGFNENKIIKVSCKEFIKEDRKWISIAVRDNGPGVPDNIKDKIFDPFFSTKTKDLGTGLGLSISYGIIEEHHGEILLETKKDEYTQFTVILPCDNGWELE